MEFEWDPRKAEINLKSTAFHLLKQEQSLVTNWQLQFLILITLMTKTVILQLVGQRTEDY